MKKKGRKPSIKAEKEKLRTLLHRAIRERDGNTCISCGRSGLVAALGGTWQAGHLFAVGSHPSVQFHPWNIASQCSQCNSSVPMRGGRGGNHAAYSAEFIRRRGLETFLALDAASKQSTQLRVHDLIELRAALSGGLEQYQRVYFSKTGWVA